MEAVIKSLLKTTFPTITVNKIDEITSAVMAAGVEVEQDLCLICEDLKSLLPVIQARKLIASIKSKYAAAVNIDCMHDENVLHETQNSASTPLSGPGTSAVSAQSSVSGRQVLCTDNWVKSFAVPWHKCSSTLLQSLEISEQPAACD
jgi:hypothetical protein